MAHAVHVDVRAAEVELWRGDSDPAQRNDGRAERTIDPPKRFRFSLVGWDEQSPRSATRY